MKKIVFLLLLLNNVSYAQNYLEWIMVSEEGENTFQLLTQQGYEILLEPIQTGNLGELSSELLTQRAEIVDNYEEIEALIKAVKKLDKRIKELEKKVSEKPENEIIEEGSWDEFKQNLKQYSKSKFKQSYTEKELVEISKKRSLLPDFLKSEQGKVSDKRNWFFNNKGNIDNF